MDVPAPGPWQQAVVTDIVDENARVKTLRLQLPDPRRHVAGQHCVVRLTASDGYTAQRSYSIGSAPSDDGEIDLTVERLADGEVSTFLHDELLVGDTLEVRGPIGGWFVWDGTAPALLVGGGVGVVPLMSMLRFARSSAPGAAHLVLSVRSPADRIYVDDLEGEDTTMVYSRVAPISEARPAGRLTVGDLAPHVRCGVTAYLCGSATFVAAAADRVVDAGVARSAIRIEQFGPTGAGHGRR
jgi:ferredoxin-NADP reductase